MSNYRWKNRVRDISIYTDYILLNPTLKQLGVKYGLTPERIRQINAKTERKLRVAAQAKQDELEFGYVRPLKEKNHAE